MKSIRIKLVDSEGISYFWSVQRVPRAVQCMVTKTRIISGWQYTDHDNYPRFAEGNWNDLVASLRLTADNYGFTTTIS